MMWFSRLYHRERKLGDLRESIFNICHNHKRISLVYVVKVSRLQVLVHPEAHPDSIFCSPSAHSRPVRIPLVAPGAPGLHHPPRWKSQLKRNLILLVVPAKTARLNHIGPTLVTGPLLNQSPQSEDGMLRAGHPSCLPHPVPGSRDGVNLIYPVDWKRRGGGSKRPTSE